jgi:hypothetical protein
MAKISTDMESSEFICSYNEMFMFQSLQTFLKSIISIVYNSKVRLLEQLIYKNVWKTTCTKQYLEMVVWHIYYT